MVYLIPRKTNHLFKIPLTISQKMCIYCPIWTWRCYADLHSYVMWFVFARLPLSFIFYTDFVYNLWSWPSMLRPSSIITYRDYCNYVTNIHQKSELIRAVGGSAHELRNSPFPQSAFYPLGGSPTADGAVDNPLQGYRCSSPARFFVDRLVLFKANYNFPVKKVYTWSNK